MNIKKISLLLFLSMVMPGAMIYSAAGEEKESDRSGENRKRKNDDKNSSRKKETSSRDDVINNLRKISSLRQGFDLVGLSYDNFLDGQDVFIPEVDKDHNNNEMSVQMMILDEMMLFDAMNSVTEKAESIIVEEMSLLLEESLNDAIDSQTDLDDLGMRLYSYAIGRKYSFGKFILQAMDMPNIFLRSAFYNNIQIVKLMIEAGIDVNVCDVNSFTVLMVAAQNGHAEVVRILIDAGADINTRILDRGFTALMIAAQNGYGEIIQMLIDAGADLNRQSDEGLTVLMIAAQDGYVEIVQMLIDAGAEINIENNEGLTALMLATEHHHIDIVRALMYAAAIYLLPSSCTCS